MSEVISVFPIVYHHTTTTSLAFGENCQPIAYLFPLLSPAPIASRPLSLERSRGIDPGLPTNFNTLPLLVLVRPGIVMAHPGRTTQPNLAITSNSIKANNLFIDFPPLICRPAKLFRSEEALMKTLHSIITTLVEGRMPTAGG